MIRASLRGLKGSASEQENVKATLRLFAIVPGHALSVGGAAADVQGDECWLVCLDNAHPEVAADLDRSITGSWDD